MNDSIYRAVVLTSTIENNLAPNITTYASEFLEDLSTYKKHEQSWIHTYFLNTFGAVSTPDFLNILIINLLRKTISALDSYQNVVELIESQKNSRPSISIYFQTLERTEACVSYCDQAIEISERLFKELDSTKKFLGDIPKKNRAIYNKIKHVKAMAQPKAKNSHGLLVWLNQEGIATSEICLSYKEIVKILKELSDQSSALAALKV